MSECRWHKKYKEANELFINGKINEKEYMEKFDQVNECCDYCVAVICKKDKES